MTALLASMFSLVAGLVLGAAIQRWGDGTLATEHHTKPLPKASSLQMVEAISAAFAVDWGDPAMDVYNRD